MNSLTGISNVSLVSPMNDDELHHLLSEAVSRRGRPAVAKALQVLLESEDCSEDSLTIVANAGIHEVPSEYLRGEVYEASHGNWDARTQESLVGELTAILSRLALKLRSRQWKRVYLIPTGHPILSLQIKTMVYRLLRMNTIDLYYKAGSYLEVDIDHRDVALTATGEQKGDS